MSKSERIAHQSGQLSGQTRAAWRVLVRRPLALGILFSLLPLVAGALSIFDAVSRGSLRSGVPQYTDVGNTLRMPHDISEFFRTGDTDHSIVGLDFQFGSPTHDAAEIRLVHEGESRVRSMSDIVPFEEAAVLVLQFPNLKWIRFREQQLRKMDPKILNQMAKLETIEFDAVGVEAIDIERLSQFSQLRRLKLKADWCDADLSILEKLPHLTCIHLTSQSTTSSERSFQRLLSRQHVGELAKLPHLKELIIESRTLPADRHLPGDRLSAEESKAVVEFAASLAPADQLRTLYVGLQNNAAKRQALRELKAALPQVSIHPAWYNAELGGTLYMGCFACIICLAISGVHFVSCSSLPQTGIVPGVESANLRLFCQLVIAAVFIQFVFLCSCANAAPLAAASICFTVTALALLILRRVYVEVGGSAGRQNNLVGVLIGLCPAVLIFGVMGLGDRLEWFMCGEQPALATSTLLFRQPSFTERGDAFVMSIGIGPSKGLNLR